MVSEDELFGDLFGDVPTEPSVDADTKPAFDATLFDADSVDTRVFIAPPNTLGRQFPSPELDDSNLEAWVQDSVLTADTSAAVLVHPEPSHKDKDRKGTKVKKSKPAHNLYAPKPQKNGSSGKILTAIGIVLVSIIGSVFFISSSNAKEATTQPQPVVRPADTVPPIAIKDWTGVGPPGFAAAELSSQNVPATSVVAPTEHGLVIIYGKWVGVYKSGVRISPLMTGDAPVKFVLATQINGREVLAWRAGNVLNIWNPETPGANQIKIAMAPATTVSSAGTGLLFHLGGETFTTDGTRFHKVVKPARAGNAEPMSYDGTEVIASDTKGNVWKLGVNENAGAADSIDVESPGVGLKLSKFVTAGHGHIVSIWRKQGDTRATVVVNSTETGKIESKHVVNAGSVANETWIRGSGFQLAAFGGLLYDIDTGKLVLDGIEQGIVFNRPLGAVATGSDVKGDLIFEYNKTAATAWRTSVSLIGLDYGNAVVQQNPQTIRFFATPM